MLEEKCSLSPLQKDAEHAVVVAVSSRAVFEREADEGDEVYGSSVAFPLLQALQRVNERLLEENPAESLLFDVILITTDSKQQQQRSRIISSTTHYGNLTLTIISSTTHYGNLTLTIISSTTHYGLEVSRFCFSSEEDFIESLLKNNVHLFLTTDRNEALQASQKGVFSALLDQQTASCPSEQLRVLFCGDAIIRPDTDPMPASRRAAQSFSTQLGEMRSRFGALHSPVSFILLTSHGDRESCGDALRMLRSRGVTMDEAYCLAGAPRGPILSLLHTHFLLSDGFSGLED
ncbi:hypothetical protein L3Q82_023622 [Scortum barcoo]|uniref:Uncharacterized protein n=1 Tax=Scortum barcoo TaxID=214431 RepID=A0ACB8WTC2_9TELE|nr:hypothetical protein L3Q82_023622 [Scortum barcoo]